MSPDFRADAGAYETFEFWKDADEDIPLLVNARREYAALRETHGERAGESQRRGDGAA